MLLNPWVSSPESAARALLRHYYWRRLRDRELWCKIAAGSFDIRRFAHSLLATFRAARGVKHGASSAAPADPVAEAGTRIDRAMAQALEIFTGRILLVLGGRDRTAAQYSDVVARSPRWRALLRGGRAARLALPDADHTFSRHEVRDALAAETLAWLRTW